MYNFTSCQHHWSWSFWSIKFSSVENLVDREPTSDLLCAFSFVISQCFTLKQNYIQLTEITKGIFTKQYKKWSLKPCSADIVDHFKLSINLNLISWMERTKYMFFIIYVRFSIIPAGTGVDNNEKIYWPNFLFVSFFVFICLCLFRICFTGPTIFFTGPGHFVRMHILHTLQMKAVDPWGIKGHRPTPPPALQVRKQQNSEPKIAVQM